MRLGKYALLSSKNMGRIRFAIVVHSKIKRKALKKKDKKKPGSSEFFFFGTERSYS